jgi:nucleotide-binding universal stress UspA family protein
MKPIVYTTDLDGEGVAFEHSLALARAAGTELVSLHASGDVGALARMPDAAQVLTRWGDVANAVTYHKRVHDCCEDPIESVLDALSSLDPVLVVASTHRRGALARFFAGSRAEAIAHNVTAPMLLLSDDVRGFVSPRDGSIALDRIVVPIGEASEGAAAVRAALWLVELAHVENTELVLLHVGGEPAPEVPIPTRRGLSVRRQTVNAAALEGAILDAAATAAVIVMATRGHDSVADVLLGSHTDRVLHHATCPVLSVAL